MFAKRTASLLVLLVVAAASFGQAGVGKITSSLRAEVRTSNSNFIDARVGRGVNNGDVIRTGRRALAEVTFKDTSMIRVNERTEMVIQDAGTLRKLRLNSGALWVKDRGTHTSIQTPVGTATARGTEWTITAEGEVDVFEGVVDLESNGKTITLGAGESGGFSDLGDPYKLPEFRSLTLPTSPNGERQGWWTVQFGTSDGQAPRPKSGMNNFFDTFSAVALPSAVFVLGSPRPGGSGIKAVPEPASIVVLGLAAGTYALRRRR